MNKSKILNYIFVTILLFILSLSIVFKTTLIKIVLASIIVLYTIFICRFFKKRKVVSINKNTVTLIITVSALIYLMGIYLLGLKFGFYKTLYPLNFKNIIYYTLPIIIIIVCYEIIRFVLISTENKIFYAASYMMGIMIDVILFFNFMAITNFNEFMNLMGMILFPTIISNNLYQYLCKNYGYIPNIIYKIITCCYSYFISLVPAIDESVFALINLVYPLFSLLIVKVLFDSRQKTKISKMNPIIKILSVISYVLCIMLYMLFSNQFRYKTIVIATDSMKGEINRGDIVIYEQYQDEEINVGEIILFTYKESLYVHRVVDVKDINGELFYYTQGDANEEMDAGYRTSDDIVGYTNFKISYFGYLTLWLRAMVE